jgi:hypothetical protein
METKKKTRGLTPLFFFWFLLYIYYPSLPFTPFTYITLTLRLKKPKGESDVEAKNNSLHPAFTPKKKGGGRGAEDGVVLLGGVGGHFLANRSHMAASWFASSREVILS